MANYAFGRIPIPQVEDGHVFIGDNFCQLSPHTKICEGVKGLRFVNCNLTNCDLPADAQIEYCALRHIEFCSNVRPDLIRFGLPQCPQNCSHVTSVDSITIDGIVVDQVYYYEHRRVE